ncbi:hypothetical protein L1987_65141 [Smallanthus sonchifolius]|uniref:Uncharacterized protein n=1 Tax=Smallanthus sonchifolius TaxID=185202 RepID=A0ACB9BTR1_9ASTR|nr:hypothetical protein L1987_65141 [Smallanthus sonchifolius]
MYSSGDSGVPVDSYITKFVWDEAKYPTMSPLKEIVDGIHVHVAKIYDDLKVRIAEYNNVQSQLNAINRKQTGRGTSLSIIERYGVHTRKSSSIRDSVRKKASKNDNSMILFFEVQTPQLYCHAST